MALSLIPSEYIPDKLDDPSSFLPSFLDLRRKNLRTLYGDISDDIKKQNHSGNNLLPIDKSPKGCVDEPIQNLCDWINSHPSYVTLSSCSGRIAIFDPKKNSNSIAHEHRVDDNEGNGNGGKGRGEWIFISHELIDPMSILDVLSSPTEDESTSTLLFKFEPLVLHIAASSLIRGRQLLTLATSLGYRESGLMVTSHRVTVAIRSHSLAWTVPLARSGPLRPPQEYLIALGQEANQHMKQNHRQMQKFEQAIQNTLFVKNLVSGPDSSFPIHPNQLEKDAVKVDPGFQTPETRAYFQQLPDLNLWGHDVVIIPSKDDTVGTILVFGGYGSGPTLKGADSKHNKTARRNSIYFMTYQAEGNFSAWNEISHSNHLSLGETSKSITTWYGVDVVPSTFSPREGLQACLLPLEVASNTHGRSAVIALWGGRTNPSNPLDDLLLFEFDSDSSSDRPSCFYSPKKILGDIPSPRWGHTLTALSGKDGMMAVLIGGRNDKSSSQDTVYIFRLVEDLQGKQNFIWNRIYADVQPQFHHSVTKLVDDTILISSGLMDPKNLTECFFSSGSNVGNKEEQHSQFLAYRVTSSSLEQIVLVQQYPRVPHFGAGLCCFLHHGRVVIAFAGGLPFGLKSSCGQPTDISIDSIRWYTMEGSSFSKIVLQCETTSTNRLDLAALVHTRCIPMPCSSEFLILGGGVASFAFGPMYAGCFHIRLDNIQSIRKRDISVESKQTDRAFVTNKSHLVPNNYTEINPQNDGTNVFYVETKDAKALRTILEKEGLLDKNYRMTKADALTTENDENRIMIAVPVIQKALDSLTSQKIPYWAALVLDSGCQTMPFSTAVLGSRKQTTKYLTP